MLKFAVVVAPLAIIALWGSSYVLDCIHTLEAPGVPFQFTFHTRSGDLTIQAQSYALAAGRGSVYIRSPELRDASGKILASLDALEVTGISLTRGADQIIRVRGRNFKGTLTRYKNGRFDIQDFLPEHAASENPIPFDIEIDRGQVDFVDENGPSPWKRTLTAPQVKVVGVGQDWVASANAQISDAGAITTRIQNIKDVGLQVTGSTSSLQLDSVFKHFQETSDAAKIHGIERVSCDSLVVKGPFQLFLPKEREPNLEATVEATANGIRFDKFTASTATFAGRVNLHGMVGALELVEGDSSATFRGSSVWEGKPRAAGDLIASVPESGGLPTWAKTFLPANSSFTNGAFHGWISVKGAENYHLTGSVEASVAKAFNRRLDDIRVGIDVEPDEMVLKVDRAMTMGSPISGVVTIDPKLKSIGGFASADNLALENLSAEFGANFGLKQATGKASVAALIRGKLSDPDVDFALSGQGNATILKDHTIALGHFAAAGSYSAGGLSLDQAYFNTPNGLIGGHGSVGQAGDVGIDIIGRGVSLAAYDQRLGGSANFTARITGKLRDPLATGRIESYDLAFKSDTRAAVVADFKLDRHHAEIDDLQAARGTTSLSGAGTVQFGTGRISGSATVNDVQIADWLGEEFVGAVDMPHIDVDGTIAHPMAQGSLQGTSLVTRGVKLDNLSAKLSLDGTSLRIDDLKVDAAQGSVSGSTSYDIDSRRGQIVVSGSGLELSQVSINQLIPELDKSTVVNGKVSGEATVAIEGGNLVSLKGEGTLDQIALNDTHLGSGNWTAGFGNRVLTGSIEVGGLDRFIRLTDISFDPDQKRVKGDLSVLNFQAEDLVAIGLAHFSDLSYDTQDNLRSLRGKLNLACTFDATQEDPSVDVSSLQIQDISYRQQPLGELNATFGLTNHKWTLGNVSLSKGPANLAAKGVIDERGETHIDATTDNRFDLSKFAHFDPRLSRLTGTAHLWLSADGPTSSPRIVASLNVDDLFGPPDVPVAEEADDKYLRFELDQIVIDPASKSSPGIAVKGAYYYKGFRGTISASAPFEYPFQIPNTGPVNADVSFEKSELKAIAPLVGGLDASRSDGSIAGSLKIQGTSDALDATGSINLDATAVAFLGMNDVLRNVKAAVTVAHDKFSLNGAGDSSKGGQLTVDAAVPIQDIGQMVAKVHTDGPASLLELPITGSASASNLTFDQKVLGQSSVAGSASSKVTFGGTIGRPTVSGELALASGDVVFNGLPTGLPKVEAPAIDPSFDLKLTLKDQARLRSSTADMRLSGSGTLQGSLENPKVDALLTVEKGTIRLPASLLRLAQGGTVRFNYGVQSPHTASAVVDMEGSTSVSASRYGDLDVQRYDITLGMKGDLLQTNGLNLVATSDPPDLTQDRILGILGETDLLQTLSSAGKENSAVQAALLSAVPGFLDPWTGQLAEGLGLDYLNLEYNAFDQASVTFGKALGLGLSVEGNRQLSEPPPGLAMQYDLRILYHPRRLPGVLHQFSLFFGADQDNPWKVGVQYGVRF